MTQENFYKLLQVDRKADQEIIRSAYRRLARECHPDVSSDPEDHERFKLLNEAYNVLSDAKKRRQYDIMCAFSFGLPLQQLRERYGDPQTLQKVMRKVGTSLASAAGLFKRNKAKPGRDLRVETTVSFAESYTGTQVETVYMRAVHCGDCQGTGYTEIEPCLACRGTGKLASEGFPGISKRCPRCNGIGWRGVQGCPTCEKTGRVSAEKRVTVKVPAGVQNKQRLRLAGLGEEGMGLGGSGKSGDLIVVVNIDTDNRWERSGKDLKAVLEIPWARALAGGKAEIELPDARLTVTIPPLSWDRRLLRLPGRGFSDARGGQRGDCFLRLSLIAPEQEPERELYEEYIASIVGPGSRLSDAFKEKAERNLAK